MTVIFDLYLFNEKYVDEARKKEISESHAPDPDVDLELGAISCRNTERKQPIFFYDVEELAELLEAAYAVGKSRDAHEQIVGVNAFPPDSVIPNRIELERPVAGKLIDPDGRVLDFGTRQELSAVVGGQLPQRPERD